MLTSAKSSVSNSHKRRSTPSTHRDADSRLSQMLYIPSFESSSPSFRTFPRLASRHASESSIDARVGFEQSMDQHQTLAASCKCECFFFVEFDGDSSFALSATTLHAASRRSDKHSYRSMRSFERRRARLAFELDPSPVERSDVASRRSRRHRPVFFFLQRSCRQGNDRHHLRTRS